VLDRAEARGELPSRVDRDLLIDMISGVIWYRALVARSPMPEGDLPDLIERTLLAFGVRGER
jgi:hypothetical protein